MTNTQPEKTALEAFEKLLEIFDMHCETYDIERLQDEDYDQNPLIETIRQALSTALTRKGEDIPEQIYIREGKPCGLYRAGTWTEHCPAEGVVRRYVPALTPRPAEPAIEGVLKYCREQAQSILERVKPDFEPKKQFMTRQAVKEKCAAMIKRIDAAQTQDSGNEGGE